MGSVFKPLMAAQLSSTTTGSYVCSGSVRVGDKRKFHCAGGKPHFAVADLDDAVTRSCNAYAITMGLRNLDWDALADLSGRFLDRPIYRGDDPVKKAETIIGQTVLATPMQGALLAGAIAADGLKAIPVYLLDDKHEGTRVLPKETAQQLQLMMRHVVQRGTATATLADLGSKYRLSVKTGTAEKIIHGQKRNVTWLIGFFGPNRDYAFAVVVSDTDKKAAAECSDVVRQIVRSLY